MEDEFDRQYNPEGYNKVSWDCSYKGCNILWHEDGTCISCDFRKQMLAAKDWSDPNFIEAWDYGEYWMNKYYNKS